MAGHTHSVEIHYECLTENLRCVTPPINTHHWHTLTTDLNSACFSGEPTQFDPTFTGPIHNRSCTDIICCVLFMLVIAGYIVVGILAWLYGDPRHVLYPRNSTGMFCGIGQNKDKPNVMYFDIIKCATATNVMAAALQGLQCPTTQVCVKSCPSEFWILSPLAHSPSANPANYFKQEYCVPSFQLQGTRYVISSALQRDKAALHPGTHGSVGAGAHSGYFVGDSHPRLCVCVHSDLTNSFNIKDVGLRIFEDFAKSWHWIVAGLVIAMVVSVLFLLLLRFTAPVLIWVLIIGVLAVGAFGKFTSVALGHMMSTLFYPIVTFVLLLVCVSYWGITALYLATSGAPVYKVVAMNTTQGDCSVIRANETCDPEMFNTTQYPTCPSARCVFINYNTEGLFQKNLFNLQIYNVIAFLWCVNFVIALGHCTLAGAFASYYWAFSKPADIPTFPLIQSFMRALRYHVGSLAFGALILTLVQIVRIILEYLDHKFKEAQNPCTRFIMCCLKCCFYCLEKFIKFINRNAYIMIAIYGKNFCVSAKNAFSLLMRNIIRDVEFRHTSDLWSFMCELKLMTSGLFSGVLAFFFFSGRIQTPGTTFETAALNYYWMPIITVVFGAYLIAHGFFSVYNMGVDTLFLCFLEDLERNDGSPQKPYFMSKNLMKILNKKNKPAKTG
uniref:Choline transporter-like protein n=1 Tax=Sinocyclocheilus anshuiensis TaxID=1608454 RepID=A0A671KNI7_9TELE